MLSTIIDFLNTLHKVTHRQEAPYEKQKGMLMILESANVADPQQNGYNETIKSMIFFKK